MRKRWIALGVVLTAIIGLWLNNTSAFMRIPPFQSPGLIAHRGVHHIYAGTERSAETCRAAEVEPITHGFIENTLPSMRAAFEAGADVVEIDVHLTPDGAFAVFHDWTLDCQTDGSGVTHETPMAALRGLDLGHGISADGETYPLRGAGVGLLPSLDEVFSAQLPGPLLINFKSDRRSEGRAMTAVLAEPRNREQVWAVYGGQNPTREVLSAEPRLRGYDKASLIGCLKDYALWGWSGRVPESCENQIIGIPLNYAPFIWGWPHRFTDRMARAGTTVILWGPYDGSGFTSGIDDPTTLARVPAQFDGYIWTNRIEVIGPLVKRR